jgi:hypothetical protein
LTFLSQLDWPTIFDYFLAAVVGMAVSSGELIARYRDEPWATLRSAPAVLYMLVNAAASMIALTIVRALGLNFGATGEGVRLVQVIVAGLGAMAIFRSAFFTVRVGNDDVAVGAASFLQVVLDAADREVDRRRATLRARNVRRIMEGISFDKALTALPIYSIQLMQNLNNEDQTKLATDVNRLLELETVEDAIKAQMLGLAVMNFLGEDVLEASVESLRKQIGQAMEGRAQDGAGSRPQMKFDLDRLRGIVGQKEGTAPEESSGEGQTRTPPPSGSTKAQIPRLDIDELLSKAKETAESKSAENPPTDPGSRG